MLVGSYPFEDPEDPKNFRKIISVSSLCSYEEPFVYSVQNHIEITSYAQQQIASVQYSIPDYVRVSKECRQLLSRIFVADPSKRITIPEIKKHPWFQKNLPKEIIEVEKTNYIVKEQDQPSQSVEEIMRIILEAKKPAKVSKAGDLSAWGLVDADDAEANADTEEVDNSGDFLAPI